MNRILEVKPDDRRWPELYATLNPGAAADDPIPPSAVCLLLLQGEAVRARCSLIEPGPMHGVEARTLLLGHFEALDATSGEAILREARRQARGRGVDQLLGPMNGNTWRRYRLALPSRPDDPFVDPPFFPGEPRNPAAYPDYFERAGFGIVAQYESRLDTELRDDSAQVSAERRQLASQGILVRNLDMARFEDELGTLYRVSLAAFAGNPYYSPISEAEFRSQYAPLRSRLDPSFVFLAERGAKTLAFTLCYEDPTAGARRRLMVKSLATVPAARGLGLGTHFMHWPRHCARERGFGEFLYALMHVDNVSRKLSDPTLSKLYRRYALYACRP